MSEPSHHASLHEAGVPVEGPPIAVAGIDETPVSVLDTANVDPAGRGSSLARSLAAGVFSVGGALALERGAGFLANMLAARLAGAAVFGAYSLSLNTANNVATYAGAGIGYTATRFVAEYPEGSRGRQQVLRTILLFAALSAVLAAVLLWMGAASLARTVLKHPEVETPLKVAALSAAAFVALECCRGVFLGTREFRPFLFLSGLVGIGSLVAIPTMAHLGPSYMLAGQGTAVLVAALVSALLIIRRQPKTKQITGEASEKVSLWNVWRFGLVQLGGVVGLNAAGWWTATLVARGDATLVQVAFYGVATQWRNICGLIPNLVQQGNFAFFTDRGSADFGGADRVVSVSAVFASALGILCAGFVILPIPFVLTHFYGRGYSAAELPAAFAVATVIVHLGISPAASRLTVVSLRWTAVINAIWSVAVIAAGTLLIPNGGAAVATAVLFGAHVLSVFLTVFALWQLKALPSGLPTVAAVNILLGCLIGGLAFLRATRAEYATAANILLLICPVLGTALFIRVGQSCGALPRTIDWASLFAAAMARVKRKKVSPAVAAA